MIHADAWQPADGLTLEPNALRAAKEQSRSLALTAGPGAGKTEMLAQRADFLLRTGVSSYPKRILAISFKVDASTNLKERVLRRCGVEFASRFDSYTFHAFAKRIIDRFRVLLTGADSLTPDYTIGDRKIAGRQIAFENLVPLAIKILRNSNIARNAIRQTYSDVFLDEFQDCTNLQYELLKIAFQGTNIRLTAVGDTKQKIMGWAGALEGIFEFFARDFAALPLNMYRNFRSRPRLLRMQNEIIRVLDPNSAMPEEQIKGNDGEIYAWQFVNSAEEARFLANLIANWMHAEQVPLSEIAVLVSKQLDLYAIHLMAELEARGIPYRNEQRMQDVSAEPVARLIVDYLSCLYGQKEPKAWVRLTNLMLLFADDEQQINALIEFNQFIKEKRKEVAVVATVGDPFAGWWEQVRAFLNKIGLETLVALSPDYESRTRLKEVVKDTKGQIEGAMQRGPNLLNALQRFSDDQSVRILTIHKSKGLEFDSVIMLAIENEIFFGDVAENRCAFFVGMSRAKRRLILTCANERERPPNCSGRWYVQRSCQNEYMGYAAPFITQSASGTG